MTAQLGVILFYNPIGGQRGLGRFLFKRAQQIPHVLDDGRLAGGQIFVLFGIGEIVEQFILVGPSLDQLIGRLPDRPAPLVYPMFDHQLRLELYHQIEHILGGLRFGKDNAPIGVVFAQVA